MKKGICQLCGRNTDLIEAHILPKAFYKDLKAIEEQDIHLTSLERQGTIKNGIKDPNILCKDCDNVIGVLDNAAISFFRKDFSPYKKRLIDKNTGKSATYFSIPKEAIQTKTIILFFLSFLFRGSISRHPVFQEISLGSKYEKLFREAIINQTIPREFEVFIGLFQDPSSSGGKMSVFPAKTRFEDGTACYVFYYNLFKIFMKVDNRKWIINKAFSLNSDNDVIIADLEDFKGSKARQDFVSMLRKVKSIHANKV